MKIAVLGAGSIGLLLAAKLSEVCSVELITRTEEQAEAVRLHGIQVESKGDEQKRYELRDVYAFENDSKAGLRDPLVFLFLTVKQSAIHDELLTYMKGRCIHGTTIVCLQNGIGHEDKLMQICKPEQLLLAITSEGARKLSSTSVAHTGIGITYIGFSNNSIDPVDEARQKKCCFLLENAGFTTSLSNNMKTRVWSKLIVNSVINPITALMRVRNGELLKSGYLYSLMTSLYDEGLTVAAAAEVELPPDLWQHLLVICELTGDNHSSMLQDIMHQRGTEIEQINGSILRMADELLLELPVNRTLYRLIKALENK